MDKVQNMPLGIGVKVLKYNRSGLIAFFKPRGVLSHPNRAKDRQRSLLDGDYDMKEEQYSWKDNTGERRVCYLLNRLDAPTTGIILGALNLVLAKHVRQCFRAGHIEKKYSAIVLGFVPDAKQIWIDQLKRIATGGVPIRVSRGEDYSAKTAVRGIAHTRINNLALTLVEMIPITGKTHQLRVQSALSKHPILGDKTYGNFKLNKQLLANTKERCLYLHAAELNLKTTWKGGMLSFHVKCPYDKCFSLIMEKR